MTIFLYALLFLLFFTDFLHLFPCFWRNFPQNLAWFWKVECAEPPCPPSHNFWHTWNASYMNAYSAV